MWLSHERGLLPASEIYEVRASERAQRLLYYLKGAGRFYCDEYYMADGTDRTGFLLLYVVSGVLLLDMNGREEQVSEGELVFLSRRQEYRLRSQNKLEFLWVYMDGVNTVDFCNEILLEYGNIIHLEHAESVSGYMKRILTLFQDLGEIEEIMQSKLLYEMLCSILYRGDHTEHSRTRMSSDPQIEAIKRYFREHMNEEISTEELARNFHLSISQINRKFRDHTGQSPHEYLTNLRLNRAKVLLRDSQMTIAEIAGEVGYAYDTSLASAFRKKMGMSPREFRNKLV